MAQGQQTRARILDTAERLLRRHGPAKMTVVDVARALEMSHSNVYKHFPSKEALRAAVAERWLSAISTPLEVVSRGKGRPPERLRGWFHALHRSKRRKVSDDPELFATYHGLAEGAQTVVKEHVAHLASQIERIVRDGVRSGDFSTRDPRRTARALLDATTRFHHPHFVRTEASKARDLDRVLAVLVSGLNGGPIAPRNGRSSGRSASLAGRGPRKRERPRRRSGRRAASPPIRRRPSRAAGRRR
jgi:AcrR family transcriptional regulator